MSNFGASEEAALLYQEVRQFHGACDEQLADQLDAGQLETFETRVAEGHLIYELHKNPMLVEPPLAGADTVTPQFLSHRGGSYAIALSLRRGDRPVELPTVIAVEGVPIVRSTGLAVLSPEAPPVLVSAADAATANQDQWEATGGQPEGTMLPVDPRRYLHRARAMDIDVPSLDQSGVRAVRGIVTRLALDTGETIIENAL